MNVVFVHLFHQSFSKHQPFILIFFFLKMSQGITQLVSDLLIEWILLLGSFCTHEDFKLFFVLFILFLGGVDVKADKFIINVDIEFLSHLLLEYAFCQSVLLIAHKVSNEPVIKVLSQISKFIALLFSISVVP